MNKIKLEKKDFWGIFWRSFFIQAVWNYQSMLSVGFSFSMKPVARKISATKAEMAKFFLRHIGFFNAHPFLASFALGAVARVETDIEKDEAQIERLKSALIGPLGALGDQLFWAAIKPATILLGIFGIFFLQNVTAQVIAVALFLALYNLPHFFIRWHGIVSGYKLGFNVYKILNLNNFKTLHRLSVSLSALLLGLILGYAAVYYNQSDYLRPAIFAFAVGCSYFMWQLRKSFYLTILLTIGFTLILGVIINIL